MKKKILINLSLVMILCLISRCVAAFYFADVKIDNEWGNLVHNLYVSGTLGINVDSGIAAESGFAEVGDKVLPSIYMPPLYAYYIYTLKILTIEFFDLVKIVIISQILLSCLSVLIFFKIIRNFIKYKTSIYLSYIFALFPLNIFSAVQVSSITLQLFLFLLYAYFLVLFLKEKTYKKIINVGIFSGFLMLIRGEFILLFILTILYLLFVSKVILKKIIIFIFFSMVIISPHIMRNYINFNSFILTKSFGYNLLKGNNPETVVQGNPEYMDKVVDSSKILVEKNNRYEINLDNLYRTRAIEHIKDDPLKYIKLYFKKILVFTFFNVSSTYPNYYNILHIVPKIFLSILSLYGGIILLRKSGFLQYISLFYFINIFLFSIFFILPRYSLMLLPIQIILSYYAVKNLKLSV